MFFPVIWWLVNYFTFRLYQKPFLNIQVISFATRSHHKFVVKMCNVGFTVCETLQFPFQKKFADLI